MATITADKVIGKSLYAKSVVNVYNVPGGAVVRTIATGGLIGQVYSWVTYNGEVYWQFYNAYRVPYYVKHDSNLELPGLSDILTQIKDENIAKQIEQKGAVNYYLQKYLPYIVGAVVIAFVFPVVYKSVKK
jgi:hypothetical protein